MTSVQSFVAYPSEGADVRAAIETAIAQSNSRQSRIVYRSWVHNDVAGRPLTEPILSNITEAAFLVADITFLNFNVVYEIGFAIGQKKRAFLIRNVAFATPDDIKRVGIFDVLGYQSYQNSADLTTYLTSINDYRPLKFLGKLDPTAKIWLLTPPVLPESASRIISCIKNEFVRFKSFDPSEQPRMPARETIDQIAAASGVIIPLLPSAFKEASIHNYRAAFVAGLAHGMRKPTLLMQEGDEPAPLDVRDATRYFKHPKDIDSLIREFRYTVTKTEFDAVDEATETAGVLEGIQIGAPDAESEFQTLSNYYIRTDEYNRTLQGGINIVIGRKGSGKTALFSQVRNSLRRNRSKVIVDLKPEGFQLLKLRDVILRHLEAGSKAHLVTAFWEYILLLEVAHKLLENEQFTYKNDQRAFEVFLKLEKIYESKGYIAEGDFSERLIFLSSHLAQNYEVQMGERGVGRLSSEEIERLLYVHDLRELVDAVSKFLELKEETWILFDNVDKAWSTAGVSDEDVIVISGLIEAARKLEREMRRKGHEFHCVVFLRNDVYRRLLSSIPDHGKYSIASLDWTDKDLLKEMVRKRLIYSGISKKLMFSDIWDQICEEKDGFDLLLEKALMRPRYLLMLLNHARGYAVNHGHARIRGDDLEKGVREFSDDLIVETDLEIRDVFQKGENLVYHFIDSECDLFSADLDGIYSKAGLTRELYDRATEFLIWYGFLGIMHAGNAATYIFDVGYDIKKFWAMRTAAGDSLAIYRIHPAYWPALGIKHK